MKRRRRRLRLVSALLAMMALLVGSCMTAYAAADAASVDLNQKGSIDVTLAYEDEDSGEVHYMTDGSVNLYHVADIAYDDGNEVYAYTSAFAGCDVSLADVSDENNHSLASALADWVETNQPDAGTYYSVNPDNGVVSIPDLSTGLYLLVQNTGSTESYLFDPFLVSIPYNGVYDVDAGPKVGPVTTITPTPTETPTPEPEDEKVNVVGEKIWDGDEAVSLLVRPEDVTIYLYNAEDAETPLDYSTITEADGWSFSFTDLDKYDSEGNEIDYRIGEVPDENIAAYYTPSVSEPVYDEDTYTYTINVTNTYEPTGTSTTGTTGTTGTTTPRTGTTGTTSSPGTTTGSTGSGGSKITPGTSSGTTPSSTTPGTSSTTASTLPQTGQLFWPIPFLAGGGLLCLLVGFILRRSGRRKMTQHAA